MITRWFKKKLLVRRGLSCGKRRRSSEHDQLRDFLDQSAVVRWAVVVLTTLGLLRIGVWGGMDVSMLTMVAQTVLAMGIGLIVLYLAYQQIWRSNQLLLLTLGCLVLNLLLNKMVYQFAETQDLVELSLRGLFVLPAIAPMLCTILISGNSGLPITFLLALFGLLFVSTSAELFLSTVLTGFSACYFCRSIRRRSDLLMAGVAIGCVGLFCTLVLGGIHDPTPSLLIAQSVMAVSFGILTAFVVSAILPVLEWMFDRITDISWVELTDLNHPLLRRMTIEAPGTYHHSLMVANLAEAGAEAIGANATQCRVSAYFHDIGKMNHPEYFIENTSEDRNAHDSLSPNMSALVIMAHVKDGVDLACKHRLRQPIIDVIQQHHGTSLVYYFYRKAIQQQEDVREGGKILRLREEDVPEVDERSFRYPGPIPQFKESAIVSLADSIESASRSLKNPTAQRVENLVQDIINDRIRDGQLRESGLTFDELGKVADRFTFTLKNMLHTRIAYPKDKEKKGGEVEAGTSSAKSAEKSRSLSGSSS